MYLRMVSSQGGSKPSNRRVSPIRSALHRGFSRLSRRIRSFISFAMGGLPGFFRDLQRQYNRNAAVCHLLTVAGCIRWTCSGHPFQDFDSTTQRNRKAW